MGWIMDSGSKNTNSQIPLTAEQNKSKATADTDLVTAFPDAVHVAKCDRASFANWFHVVNGFRVNLVLLRTERTDLVLKESTLSHFSLATCRNRDRMNVDSVFKICSPEVRKALERVNCIVQIIASMMATTTAS